MRAPPNSGIFGAGTTEQPFQKIIIIGNPPQKCSAISDHSTSTVARTPLEKIWKIWNMHSAGFKAPSSQRGSFMERNFIGVGSIGSALFHVFLDSIE
jgi:hypothetical protein